MEKQELQAVQELVEYIRKWCHDNHSYKQSTPFGQVLRIVNLQAAMIDELTKHGGYNLTPMTIEEKVANAVFYIEDGIQYKIDYRNNMDREFHVIDDQGNERDIDYYNRPTNSYFLGTIIL